MNANQTERVVFDIPVDFTAEEFAALCKISPESPAFEAVEDSIDDIRKYARPKSVIRWADVNVADGPPVADGSPVTDGARVSVNGVVFSSLVLADKLKGLGRVFLSVITAGHGLEESGLFEGDPMLDTFDGGLLAYATTWTIREMKERYGFDGASMLNPGSLPDWPIRNNFALFDIIGNVEEIGVTLREDGYMKPWNTTSHIHFPGHGYQNCSLCKRYDCVGRRAKFDRAEYVRIFGVEP